MATTIHDIADVEQQFCALDLRGQIVRNRKGVLDELLVSLRTDFQAGRFRAVVNHYRIFLHHAVNAYLVHMIPDSKILAGQDTPSGTDTEKVQRALDGTSTPTPEIKQLCHGLSKTLHAIHPPPDESEEVARHLMRAADIWSEMVGKEDAVLNKWYDELVAGGITPSRFELKAAPQKRAANAP